MSRAVAGVAGVAVALATVLAACGGDDDGATDFDVEPATRPDSDAAFGWTEFGGDRVQTGSLEVPIDPDDPNAGTFDLFVARHLADEDLRVGTLLVNPGGPGVGGSYLAIEADQYFSPTLVAHFDIVGWDPRGTGMSEPAIDCVDDYDRYYAGVDITPDDDAERDAAIRLAQEFQQGCVERSGEFLAHVGTNDSAADIDLLRQALGEDEISYFGFSYGSELGGVWVTRYPDTVRAAVLDGAVDPDADALEASIQQSQGFEQSLTSFLAWCSDSEDCAFRNGGDAEGAFDELMASVDANPVPTEPGRPDLDLGVFVNGVVTSLYTDDLWRELGEALADAAAGDGSGLLALHDLYFERSADGTWADTLEAFQVISCMDNPVRETPEEATAQLDAIRAAAPRIVPATVIWPSCDAFPAPEQGRLGITGAGAGPVVVIGTTGDSATPLEGTRRMAEALEEGVLIVVDAEQHTGYGTDACVTDAVDAYLVAGTVPADGLTCGG